MFMATPAVNEPSLPNRAMRLAGNEMYIIFIVAIFHRLEVAGLTAVTTQC